MPFYGWVVLHPAETKKFTGSSMDTRRLIPNLSYFEWGRNKHGMQGSCSYAYFVSFWCVASSGAAVSYGRCVFSFLRTPGTVFRNGLCHRCTRVPSLSHQHLLLCGCWVIGIPARLRSSLWFSFVVPWYLAKPIFSCPCQLFVFLLWKVSIQTPCPFLHWIVCFCCCCWISSASLFSVY